MINIYSELMSSWPASVVLAPKLSRLTPSFAQVWDYERIAPSSAVGSTVKSVQGAVGEYLERRHFFNEIRAVSTRKLHEMMPESSANAFVRALTQTSQLTEEHVSSHPFATVRAFNAFTLEQVELPAVLVALDNFTADADLSFYPSRDTCGCSCHVGLTDSINGAVGELMERQSLLLYWLTGKANYEIVPDGKTGINYVDEVMRNLCSRGQLKIMDVTLPGAPGYAILTIYGTADKENTIKYSTGLSYAASFKAALHKSVLELWQSYICMHNFIIGEYEPEDIIDRYQQHFMSCNTFSTYTELCDTTEFRNKPVQLSVFDGEAYDISDVMDFLQELTPNIFIYYARDLMSDGMLWYTKVLSPDLFLHMDNSGAININNSIYTAGTGIAAREKVMVPFP